MRNVTTSQCVATGVNLAAALSGIPGREREAVAIAQELQQKLPQMSIREKGRRYVTF